MEMGLDGCVALVGGASRGLGAASAECLSAEGARVALVARDTPRLHETSERLQGVPVPQDLSSEQGPAAAVAQTVEQLGGLDVLIVNSGGPPAGRFVDIDESDWRRAVDGTMFSALRMIRAALPHLKKSDRGSIVIILSGSVRIPLPNLVTSNVLRPGLNGLIKTLADELAPEIRINGAAPGRIHTQRADELDAEWGEMDGSSADTVRERFESMIPLGRYGRPEEFGRMVTFLASPAASYLTGQVLSADGGMSRSLP
jgi:3-oxoacyl-[acyl-carrier protein] reductase